MPTLTSFLGLSTYDVVTDGSSLFLKYRTDVAGSPSESNLQLLDRFASDLSGSVIDLQDNVKPVYYVAGVASSPNTYEATAVLVEAYTTNMIICLAVDGTITGDTTLDINSFGVKALKKNDVEGNAQQLVSGDLKVGKNYLFRYDGSQWIWVAATSGDQISMSGSSGNLVQISASGALIDSGSSIANIVATGGAPGAAPYITSASATGLTNYSVITAGSNIVVTTVGGSTVIDSTGGGSGSAYSGVVPIDITGSVISHDVSGIATGSYNAVEVNTFGHIISGSVISYLTDAVISGSDVMSDSSGCIVKHNVSGAVSGSYSKVFVNTTGHVTTGCTLQGDEIPGRLSDSQNINIWDEGVFKGQAYTLNFIGSGVTAAASSGCATITITSSSSGSSGSTVYYGAPPIDVTGSEISHDLSGIASGSYNVVEVNTYGHTIGGSVVSYLTEAVITGSDVMSDTSGCVVKHNISGITAGSYNAIEINALGHAIGGSVVSYLQNVIITGSDVMSGTSGCIVTHNVSGVVSGSYTKLYVDNVGHVTTGCSVTLDEIDGRSTISQYVNIWDEGVEKGQAYTLNFVGSGVVTSTSSGCATITITSSSSGSSGSTVYYGAPPINVTGSEISHDLSGILSGSYNVLDIDTHGHVVGGSVVSYLQDAVISGSDVMSDTSGCVVKHNISGITAGSYNAIEINALGHAIGGSVVSYLQDTVISGSDVMSDTSGCVVKHNISGITAGSYNAVEINALGHATGGSVVSYLTDVIITGSDVMSGTTGCIVKHNVSGITAGSYNAIEINVLGHAVGGSVVSYLQDVVISGSDVMSGTSGCTVKHNASGVVSGSYTKLFVDNVGHITTGCLVTADEISGRLPDSQYINVFEEGVLQGQVYSLDFLGTSVTASASSGSGTITITASGGSASGAVVSIPVVQAAHGFATGDSIYFDGISWKKAIANSLFSVGTHIAEYVNASNFNAIQAGKLTITSHGLGSDGDWLYTSSLFSGSLVSASSVIGNPLAQIIDENTLFVHDFRASDNGSTNEIGAYIISNAIEDRAYSASSVSINEFADVLATFIGDLNSGSALSYTITDITEDRTYDANLTTFGELSNVLGTLINDKIAGSSISFTVTNLTTDREYDANSTIINELADIIGNLINDLQEVGKYPAIKIINDNRYVNVSGDTMTGPLTINALLATSQGRTANTARVTTTYNVLVTDEVIFCDTDGGAFTITLPAGIEGQHFKIINCGSAGLDLTVDGDGTEKVYGELTQAIPDESVIDLHYNATEGWW